MYLGTPPKLDQTEEDKCTNKLLTLSFSPIRIMPIYLRPATVKDAPAVSRICLLTGNAGTSAVDVYSRPELIGLVYAEPYVHLSSAFAYLLVTTGDSGVEPERAIGYILGAVDSRAYEAEAREKWWPALRARYPVAVDGIGGNNKDGNRERERDSVRAKDGNGGAGGRPETTTTDGDKRIYAHFANPDTAPDVVVSVYPAHMHINVLPEMQRQGWGRRMIDQAVNHVRSEGGRGLHLGIDSRNDEARKFYRRVGFESLPSNGIGEYYTLNFDNWISK